MKKEYLSEELKFNDLVKELLESIEDINKYTNNDVIKSTGSTKFELMHDTIESFTPLFKDISNQYNQTIYDALDFIKRDI